MRQSDLRKFAPLYSAARYYGADRILLNWLGRPHTILPLVLPHGVEFPGQFAEPADMRRLEPIYWAMNRTLMRQAAPIKPSVLIPHPLVISDGFAEGRHQKRTGRLIIGAPPGQSNDRVMLEAIRKLGITNGSVLIKRRKGWEGSQAFWQSAGYETLAFGTPDRTTYSEMAAVFSRFEEVVSTTMSSAIFFGAACGAKATLIKECPYEAYELLGVVHLLSGDLSDGRAWINRFMEAGAAEQNAMSLEMLGADLADKERVGRDLDNAIAELDHPLDFGDLNYPRWIAGIQSRLAIAIGRPGLASLRPSSLTTLFSKPRVGRMTVKSIEYFVDRPSPDSFSLTPVPYRRDVTEPGHAIDPYDDPPPGS